MDKLNWGVLFEKVPGILGVFGFTPITWAGIILFAYVVYRRWLKEVRR